MTPSEQSKSPRSAPARLLRALLGVLLVLGPLVAVEFGMRQQAQWLRPVLRKYTVSMDMKLLLLEHRDRCPDLVTFGTSLTDRGLPPKYIERYSKTSEDPFDFALAGVRATAMLAQFRWLQARGCLPEQIFVEVTPVVINGAHGPTHDASLMSGRAQLGMPAGFAELRAYTLADQLELATYDRLLIHRRRGQIVERGLDQLEGEEWFISERERLANASDPDKQAAKKKKAKARAKEKEGAAKAKLPFDGKLSGHRRKLSKAGWAKEQRKRRRMYTRKVYDWQPNTVEREALLTLAREAADAGVEVVLHAPPVTALYHTEISSMLGMGADYASFTEEIAALAAERRGIVWIDAYTDESYDFSDFGDWVHLSKGGARRYTKQLVNAAHAALAAEREGG